TPCSTRSIRAGTPCSRSQCSSCRWRSSSPAGVRWWVTAGQARPGPERLLVLAGRQVHDVTVPGLEVNRGRATVFSVCAVAAVGLAGSIVAAGYDGHRAGQLGTALLGAFVAGTIA